MEKTFEVMEKYRGLCSHCLIKVRRYSGNVFQILQIEVNLNEELLLHISEVVDIV